MLLVAGAHAGAATLSVGPDGDYPRPSAAIAAAHDGDTVLIAPGTYYDCAIVRWDDITIAGSGPGVVLSDKPCAGKALLVIDGRNVTVRNLTLARVRTADNNGAGIRAEGYNLTVDHVTFDNDQDGILAAAIPGSTLVVRDSRFIRNGGCEPRCGHGILADRIRLLRVEHSEFSQASGGDHIVSSARNTVLVGDTLADEDGRMTGALVRVNDGALTLRDSTVVLSAKAHPRPGAVLIAGDVPNIVVRGNTLREPAGAGVPLLRNWSGTDATVADNSVPAGTSAVSDDGSLYHRIRSGLGRLRDSLHAALGRAKHLVAAALHRII